MTFIQTNKTDIFMKQVLSFIQNFVFKRRVVALDFLAQESPARLVSRLSRIIAARSKFLQCAEECEYFRWESKDEPKAKAARQSTAFEAPTSAISSGLWAVAISFHL